MHRAPVLFLTVLVIGTCGLVYELLAGTVASYVLGDSVTQFSLVIGIYLSALGLGAWLSRFIDRSLGRTFAEVQIGLALLGGCSAPILFLSFAELSWFRALLYALVLAIGTLVGLELPLLMRLLQNELDFKELVSRVLTFDYIGALAASLLFPLFLVPQLGLVRTSLAFGMLNALVGLWSTWILGSLIERGVRGLRLRAVLALAVLAVGFYKADALTSLAEDGLFTDPVVYSHTSAYQRIVVTQGAAGFHLFLNGNLQFSSADEYRYHEALVHPAMQLVDAPRRVLVLGGGDGLALREIFRHESIESVTLIDLDPAMTNLPKKFPPLAELNGEAFSNSKLRVINEDALTWLEHSNDQFDVAIVDFPDPNHFALGKLYTKRFYRLLKDRLTPDAAISVQCTSPLFARQSYWCIVRTMEAAGLSVQPYHVAVPSFGVWGFALAMNRRFDPPRQAPPGLRFLDDSAMAAMFQLSADLQPVDVEINRLDNQALVRYYEAEWQRWNH